MSNSKALPYYFNPDSKESRWEPPEGAEAEKLKHYMATYHSHAIKMMGNSSDEKIRAAHLLIKHNESRRPSSWRESNITRSKEDARSILLQHEQRIRSGETSLGDLAMTESDCSSARKSGDLYVSSPFEHDDRDDHLLIPDDQWLLWQRRHAEGI
jgi:NIMA-interacting peptidyl-prolyl cis-trans isomerase 1